jgi:membrane protein involved in colicin uptake
LRVAQRQETKLGAKLEAKAARDDQQRRRAATKAKQKKERAAAKSTKRTVRPLSVDGSATLASADAADAAADAADAAAGGGPRSGGHRRARAAAALASAEAAADQLAAEGATGSGRGGWGISRRQGYWLDDEAWGKGSPGGLLSRWGWGQPLVAAARPSSVGGAANGGVGASGHDPLALLKQHGATMRVVGNHNKKALAFTTYNMLSPLNFFTDP